mmetsp:Transcript_13537/g.32790  ORF Transcript_13537/g.32790 Transcript_13537/m.32790 type:complete len:194 (+) Transcript_13537:46-627(+)
MMKSFLLVLLTASPAAAFVASPAGNAAIVAAPQSLTSSTALSATSDPTSRRGMLATSLATLATLAPVVLPASAIETYLTEPTDEFKESERQRMEFRKKQLAQKGEFVKVLARLTSESSTEDELVTDLKELRALVVQTEGLPLGIKKEDFYKVIRSKKAKGFWPTNVEIAYQSLKSEVAYQQSPNREKDTENPL